MNKTGESYGQSAGNVVATSRDANGWSFRPGFGGPHAAGVDQEAPPAPRAGFAAGGEAEGGRAEARYVHKIGTSPQAVAWIGTSREWEVLKRKKERDNLVKDVVASLNRCGREGQAKALATCGKRFQVWGKPTGEYKLVPCPCDSIFCPECAHRRASPLIKKLKGMVNRPGRSYWFLTLTVPNVENLSKYDILEIQGLWSKLWESWVFQEVEGPDGKPWCIYGAVRSIECVYNPKLKSWHPHIHVLFEAPKSLPMWWLTLLKCMWNQLCGDERVLHLQRAYSYSKRGKRKLGRLNGKALREVCKYVTKCANFAADHLLVDEFLRAFKGIRKVQCCGSFFGAKRAEFFREPGEDESGIGISRKTLRGEGYRPTTIRVSIGDTFLRGDGERQLCFPYHQRVRECLRSESPPWELVAEEVTVNEQHEIEFAGAMPGKSEQQASLFDAAA